MNAVKWLVLDNLAHGWLYTTNIYDRKLAAEMLAECVRDGLVKDDAITDAGRIALMMPRKGKAVTP